MHCTHSHKLIDIYLHNSQLVGYKPEVGVNYAMFHHQRPQIKSFKI